MELVNSDFKVNNWISIILNLFVIILLWIVNVNVFEESVFLFCKFLKMWLIIFLIVSIF